MYSRVLLLSLAGLVLAASTASAVPPKLTLIQGTTTTPCAIQVRILVDPMGATANVSQFTVRYKGSCMTFASAVAGVDVPGAMVDSNLPPATTEFPICGQPACTNCSTEFDTHVVVLITPPNGVNYTGTGDKEIAVLSFTGATAGGNCKIEWDQSNPPGLKPTYIHLTTGDVFGTSLTFVPNASPPTTCPALTVTSAAQTLSGTIRYFAPIPYPNMNWVPNAQVCVSPPGPPTACGVSNVGGIYTVPALVPGPATATPTRATDPADPSSIGGGDVNLLVQALAAAVTLTPDQQLAADVNNTGVPPNVSDLQNLRRFLVFDFLQCPSCATWRFNCGTTNPAPCGFTVPTCTTVPAIDMKAIFRGDVDGSWPGRFKSTPPSPITVAFGDARWEGLEFTVPVRAELQREALTSVIFTVDYDAQALEFVSGAAGTETRLFELTLNPATPGRVHGLLTGGLHVADQSGEVLTLRFRLRQPEAHGNLAFTRLLLNDQDAPRIPEIQISRNAQVEALPSGFALTARPNPFNPTTLVEYTIPAGSEVVPVSLRVVDLSGRQVRDLMQGDQGPGRYRATWNGRSEDGELVASGVYMLKLQAGDESQTHKVVLLK